MQLPFNVTTHKQQGEVDEQHVFCYNRYQLGKDRFVSSFVVLAISQITFRINSSSSFDIANNSRLSYTYITSWQQHQHFRLFSLLLDLSQPTVPYTAHSK